MAAILAALDGSGLEKVVAASVSGARRGERVGDLSVLCELEDGLRRQPIPAAINRGGYYLSNWAALLDTVRDTGELPSMLPADLALPMVDPRDLGVAAAERLLSPLDDVGVRDVAGPRDYTPADVADALARALDRPVQLKIIPRDTWLETYHQLGFSDAAADAYARMTAVTIDGDIPPPDDPIRGHTTLQSYVDRLL